MKAIWKDVVIAESAGHEHGARHWRRTVRRRLPCLARLGQREPGHADRQGDGAQLSALDSPGMRASYDAPYPNTCYKSGVRRFPKLVCDRPDADGASVSRKARDWATKHLGVDRAANANIVRATAKTIIIPGDGPVGSRAQLIEYRDMLVGIRENVARLKKQGKSLDVIIAAKPTALR